MRPGRRSVFGMGSITTVPIAGLSCAEFSYPARPMLRVLNGVSLQINPGEVHSVLL